MNGRSRENQSNRIPPRIFTANPYGDLLYSEVRAIMGPEFAGYTSQSTNDERWPPFGLINGDTRDSAQYGSDEPSTSAINTSFEYPSVDIETPFLSLENAYSSDSDANHRTAEDYEREIQQFIQRLHSQSNPNGAYVKQITCDVITLPNYEAWELKLKKFAMEFKQYGEQQFTECLLCSENFSHEKMLVIILECSCNNKFMCRDCIQNWLEKSESILPTCPFCRSSITEYVSSSAVPNHLEEIRRWRNEDLENVKDKEKSEISSTMRDQVFTTDQFMHSETVNTGTGTPENSSNLDQREISNLNCSFNESISNGELKQKRPRVCEEGNQSSSGRAAVQSDLWSSRPVDTLGRLLTSLERAIIPEVLRSQSSSAMSRNSFNTGIPRDFQTNYLDISFLCEGQNSSCDSENEE